MERAEESSENGELRAAGASAWLVPRARLHQRLDDGAARRLITVVAGPGFGKSTLLAEWARDRRCAWYVADERDASLPVLIAGLLKVLEPLIPGLGAAVGPMTGPRGPEAHAPGVAEALAADLSEELQRLLRHDLFLVIEDVHELGATGQASAFIECLCRHAPPALHLVLSSRREVAFPIERMRGRGEILELTGTDLAFDRPEAARLLLDALGGGADAWADQFQEMTGGWPAATRLALESLRSAPRDQRGSILDALRQPGGPVFSYLAGEVFSSEPPEVRAFLRTVAPLDRFSPGLCDALVGEGAGETLRQLCQRSMFVRPASPPGWFTLHALVRAFAREQWPLAPEEVRHVHRRAAHWFDDHGHTGAALRSQMAAQQPDLVATLLVAKGSELLASGAADQVIQACTWLPPDLVTPSVSRLEAEARQIRGDWEGALACYERAGGGQATFPAALAWRMGRILYLRGDHEQALALYRRAVVSGDEPREEAQLFAWQATAHWMRGETNMCRDLAGRALELAQEVGDDQALAAAHTAAALVAAMEGDLRTDRDHYLKALHHAERAGDLLQVIRIRANLGNRLNREARYHDAIAELDEVVRLADLMGFAVFRAVGLTNRGETRIGMGLLDEAIVDSTAAAEEWRRIGSSRECWALGDLGDVYRERGDLTMARGSYEHAVALADRTGEMQGLVLALAGLARTLSADDPVAAEQLGRRAVSIGAGILHATALLAAGWVALARGDRIGAAGFGVEAEATARDRGDRAALAQAIELGVLASADPTAEAARLEEAISLWREIGNRLGEAKATFVAGALGDTPAARGRARTAQRQLRLLGVHPQAELAAGPLAAVALLTRQRMPTLTIRTLGRFEVVRAGEPVGPSAWQSRKARDLLKVAVCLHGRPVTRESLMETLWPDEDPTKLGNRLSVALATARAVLDPERRYPTNHYLVADAVAVRLNLANLHTDVDEFLADAAAGLRLINEGNIDEGVELLLEADSVYGGDFLEEDAYEDWSAARRDEARATYAGVVRTLAKRATETGNHDGAVHYYLRLLERDTFDEEAHLGLVTMLENAGRHGEARRRYRVYVVQMGELGVEPAPFPAGLRVADFGDGRRSHLTLRQPKDAPG